MGKLTGRTAVVTGAAHGPKAALGAQFAVSLAAEGAKVVAADRVDCSSVVAGIKKTGGDAIAVTMDVADECSVNGMIERCLNHFGRIDILVNNAALGSNISPVAIEELSVEAWDALMAVNVRGAFLCAKAAIPFMKSSGYGKIINVGSTTMIDGLSHRLHYVVAKGAISAMTRAMARELGPHGIRVNTLAPGLVTNPAVEAVFATRPGLREAVIASRSLKGDIFPDDLIGTLVFLASENSNSITGQFIAVDNGTIFT